MAKKPDLSLTEFLASSAPLEVQLVRKHRGSLPAGKTMDDLVQGGPGADPAVKKALRERRATIGNLEGLEGLSAAGEEEMKPRRSFLGLFGGKARSQSAGNMGAVLEGIARDKYIKNQTLRDALEDGDTVLIKGSWLVKRWKLGKKEDGAFGLPRRQELEQRYPTALWKVNELFDAKAKGTVNIVGVSHCWLGSQHPDPQGVNLDILCTTIDAMLTSTPLEDLALFIDYCSLHQVPRTTEQEAAFARAYPNTHIWYLHQGTRVWMLTKVPEKVERCEQYDQRGWTQLERALGDMVTKANFLLDLGKVDAKCTTWAKTVEVCKHVPRVPIASSEFAEAMKKAVFAVEEDREFAILKYEEAFLEAIAAAEELTFSEMGWGDDEARQLALILPQCGRLTKLALHGNKLTEKGVMTLIGVLKPGQLDKFEQLWLTNNPVSKLKKDGREPMFAAWEKTGRFRERLRL